MNKKIKIQLLVYLCSVLFLIAMICTYLTLKKSNHTVSVVLNQEVNQKEIEQIIDSMESKDTGKVERLSAYDQKEQEIVNKNLNKSKEVTGICYYGTSLDVYDLNLCAGNEMVRGDIYGCLLDEDSAYALFGCLDCIGLELKIQNRTYLVRGLFKSDSPVVLYQTGSETESYNRLELSVNSEDGEESVTQFLLQYQLSGTIMEKNYLVKLAGNLILLITLIITVILIKGDMKSKRHWAAALIAVAVIITVILQFGYLPIRLIPTKWSDFSFYSDIRAEIKDQLHLLFFGGTWITDAQTRIGLIKYGFLVVINLVFGCLTAVTMKKYHNL